jgi:hypothetical protein
MREAFFVLIVIGVLLALAALRYRRQIGAVLHIYRTLRSTREAGRTTSAVFPGRAASGKLARCPKCGTWTDEGRSIKIGRNEFYCSPECVERTAV